MISGKEDGEVTFTEVCMYLGARYAASHGNAEAAQRLMYHLLDVNNDGVVDLEELTLWVRILQVRSSEGVRERERVCVGVRTRLCLIKGAGVSIGNGKWT